MATENPGYWCSWHKGMCDAWVEEALGMCQDCWAKCQTCGGTGLIPFHPRLGLSTFCVCEFGKKKLAETPKKENA